MAGIITISEQASEPSSPASGKWNLYSTSDGLNIQDSNGANGLLPLLSGTATEYLDGTGVFSTPAGGDGRLMLESGVAVSTADQADLIVELQAKIAILTKAVDKTKLLPADIAVLSSSISDVISEEK